MSAAELAVTEPICRVRVVEGKVVFITGASRGIGAAVARQCRARGAKVFLAGLEPELLGHLCAELGTEQAAFLETDVSDIAAVEQAVAAAADRFGAIDLVLANAGVAPFGTVATLDHDALDRTLAINVVGVWNTLRATLPELARSRGHVLTVCSVASFAPLGGMHAYCASKAAAESITSAFSMEVAHLGVTVGSVHPGWIDTDMVRDAEADLPTFVRIRRIMPWPLHATTAVDDCAAAIVRGMERRAKRVYSPRSVALTYWLRPLLQSPSTMRVYRMLGKRLMPGLEDEVRALGRTLSARADADLARARTAPR
jgi:NAD(P)-dependent dehydrogenase (short-subunit alcohol dehydrogenase family)